MDKHRLNITWELEDAPSEEAIKAALYFLETYLPRNNTPLEEKIKVSLTRDGDRSGGNLLLPRLEGRFGDHLQNRKATLSEVLKKEEKE